MTTDTTRSVLVVEDKRSSPVIYKGFSTAPGYLRVDRSAHQMKP